VRRLLVLASLVVCLALAGVAGIGWWSSSRPATSAARTATPAAQTATPAAGQVLPWSGLDGYRTEEEWVVSDIASAVIGLADYARTGAAAARHLTVRVTVQTPDANATPGNTANSAPGAPPVGYSVTRESGTYTVKAGTDLDGLIAIRGHLWAPDNYIGLAESALGSLATATAPDAEPETPTTVVLELTDPRVEHLIAANRNISDRLSRRVTSAAAHEEAALLVGTLALRESAGLLADSRSELSRLTAHLAFARALRHGAPPSLAGTIAEAILLTLVNRQADALDRVRTIEAVAGTPGAASWARALRLRITGDWREPLPTNASAIERLSHARALRAQLNTVRTLDYVEHQDLDVRADWQRLMVMGNFSVEVGHLFADAGLRREFDEMTRVWPAYHQETTATPTRADLIAGLNDVPAASPIVPRAGKAGIEVVDWGRWAAFLQRHLCGYLSAEFAHLGNLGLDDEQRALTARRTPEFGQLRLFPIVRRRLAMTQTDYEGAVQATLALAAVHPEMIPPAAWETFVKQPQGLKSVPFPALYSWFQPGVPTGTAMELHIRTNTGLWREDATAAQYTQWVTLAPYDGWAIWIKLWRDTGGKPRLEDGLRAYGPSLDYRAGALDRIYKYTAGDPVAFVPVARKICDLDADGCDTLGWLLVNVDDSEGAERVFARYAAEARDRVGVSNHMYWLVDYYHDTGRAARARQIARMAAATGSHRGLETLAHLMERTGAVKEAEEIYRHIAERYTSGQDTLGAFCIRLGRRTGDKDDMEQGTRLLAKTLPRGLESWWPADAAHPPTDGARVTFTSPRARRLGLRQDDVIVAIDGLRVRDAWARPVITSLRLEPDMKVVVWREGRFEELALEVPQRWFGATFETYKPPEQTAAAPQQ
jgi:hypothetical protein